MLESIWTTLYKFVFHFYLRCNQTAGWEFTLRLHSRAYKCQRIAGELATCTGDGSAAQQHQNSGVGRVFGVIWQPSVLQCLRYERTRRLNSSTKWNRLFFSLPDINLDMPEWTYLINSEVYPGVWNNANQVWNVALIKSYDTLLSQDLLGTVKHSCVLGSFPQGQPSL